MDLTIYFRDTTKALITGCTGDPSIVNATILNGYYRDIFALDGVAEGMYWRGDGEGGDVGLYPIPAVMAGGLVLQGDVTDQMGTSGPPQLVPSSLKLSASDEIAHESLRQVSFQESFWAFPVNHDGLAMNMYFRMSEVKGWGNVAPID